MTRGMGDEARQASETRRAVALLYFFRRARSGRMMSRCRRTADGVGQPGARGAGRQVVKVSHQSQPEDQRGAGRIRNGRAKLNAFFLALARVHGRGALRRFWRGVVGGWRGCGRAGVGVCAARVVEG